jgi:WS/DGAT/MGAT family acyltransferase
MPSPAELTATSLSGVARTLLSLPLRAAAGAASSPGVAVTRMREAAQGIGEVVLAGLSPAPESPINVPIGPHRRVAHVSSQLTDFKEVKDALGGTVNDVVLAVVAGGLRTWLHLRGQRTEGLELKACVPVSTRGSSEGDAMGNRITQLVAPLPVSVADPVERLRQVREAMDGIKDSKQAVGAEVIAGAQDFAPPTILAQASRLNFSSRFYNVLVTNVPGPQFPLYVLGRRMRRMFPVAFLAGDRSLAIAAMSYDGGLEFGLIADYDALPDLDVLAGGIRASLTEYLALARG